MTRTLAWAFEEPPSQVLGRVDRAMADLHATTLATALLARLEQTEEDARTGQRRLRWTSAGHLPPLVLHPDGTAELLPGRSDLLLGVDARSPRRDHTALLPPGSTLVLYTDGLVERRDRTLTTTLEALRTAAVRHAGLGLPELVDALLHDMTRLPRDGDVGGAGGHGAGPQRGRDHDDDVAVLAVRLHPEDRPRPPEAGPSHL
ncbi:PP2C family protein-serine/threonine phosphatase [Pseudokineococcus basanitobsidens]|uniref:PP2C family protein-serine/threonine phosphatase n=1 Tax=Pseudokineococcus basanitobsidens TaxID=1926649 RepID=A0ABU8RN50_9ACTN